MRMKVEIEIWDDGSVINSDPGKRIWRARLRSEGKLFGIDTKPSCENPKQEIADGISKAILLRILMLEEQKEKEQAAEYTTTAESSEDELLRAYYLQQHCRPHALL